MSKPDKIKSIVEILKNILTGDRYYGEVVIVIRDGDIHSVKKTQNYILAPVKEKPAGDSMHTD